MTRSKLTWTRLGAVCLAGLFSLSLLAQTNPPKYRVVAFYTGKDQTAHISFVEEANQWFSKMAAARGFSFEATTNWADLNPEFLAHCQVVVFLDTRPDAPVQRAAFQKYMEHGGGWMGFHFAGFALTPSKYPQNWDWYHLEFLGAGAYAGNTWKPTSAIYRETPSSAPRVLRSPDGDQMLLTLSLASAPTPGATRCTFTGNIQARVTRGEHTNTTEKLELRKGATFAAGPFKGTLTVRQTPPSTPALQNTGALEVGLTVTGPVSKLRSVEFLDSTGSFLFGHGIASAESLPEGAELPLAFQFPTAPSGPVSLRLRYCEAAETIQVPFSISTGIGL